MCTVESATAIREGESSAESYPRKGPEFEIPTGAARVKTARRADK